MSIKQRLERLEKYASQRQHQDGATAYDATLSAAREKVIAGIRALETGQLVPKVIDENDLSPAHKEILRRLAQIAESEETYG